MHIPTLVWAQATPRFASAIDCATFFEAEFVIGFLHRGHLSIVCIVRKQMTQMKPPQQTNLRVMLASASTWISSRHMRHGSEYRAPCISSNFKSSRARRFFSMIISYFNSSRPSFFSCRALRSASSEVSPDIASIRSFCLATSSLILLSSVCACSSTSSLLRHPPGQRGG